MNISTNAKVICSDGPFGQSTVVILRPSSGEITHLVVSKDSFQGTEYMVSIDHVMESSPKQIHLNCSGDEVLRMPVFNKIEFLPSDLTGFSAGMFVMWPYFPPAANYSTKEDYQIPEGELAIRRGSRVEAQDGHVGSVDEFLIDPSNEHITHLVLREGHFWGKKDVTIPMSQIDHFKENTVFLKLDKEAIEKLPAIPVRDRMVKED
jgi:sporulation protein YlmC with PRC-barrel domain